MEDISFEPLVAAVEPDGEVTITNADSVGHSFTAPRLGIDERLSGGQEYAFTARRTGTFDYVCTFHPPEMVGRLVVTENPATRTPTPTGTPTPTPTATATPTPPDDDDDDGGGYY